MYHKIKIIFFIAVFLLGSKVASAGPDIKDGLWEITAKIEMPGMPMTMPPVEFTKCITKQNNVPYKQEQNQDCKIKNTKIERNTVTWDMQCSGRGAIKSRGKITYSGDSLKGVVKIVVEGMEMTQHMSGHRIGDCK